ncbi:DMT family transporter [Jiella mangrovi]|uniref:DMT family transporter n=1 Tax=Jiella mangrovi TaxID=2821407 RepID=A0ABS4BGN0_9HYPH|nr:DMT family transporter [Jiella mangrovi]MBP0615911.1 DMT family transporter [Jiella mangrovi]
MKLIHYAPLRCSGQASPGIGIAAILLAVFLLSLSDALVKLASDRFGLAQLIFLRSLIAAGMLMCATGIFGAKGWRLHRPVWVTVRSLLLAGMWASYYGSLPAMPLALAAAALYTAPVMMALFSACLLREPIGRRGFLALAGGLCGVFLVLRPDATNLSLTALLPFFAAACYALAAIVTRSRCAREAPLAMALNLNLVLALAAAVAIAGLVLFAPVTTGAGRSSFVLSVWPGLSIMDAAWIVVLGVFMAIIATAVAKAYQAAPSPVVGVFDNAYLAFATLWSALLFNETPGILGFGGIMLIAGSAVLVLGEPSRGERNAEA